MVQEDEINIGIQNESNNQWKFICATFLLGTKFNKICFAAVGEEKRTLLSIYHSVMCGNHE